MTFPRALSTLGYRQLQDSTRGAYGIFELPTSPATRQNASPYAYVPLSAPFAPMGTSASVPAPGCDVNHHNECYTAFEHLQVQTASGEYTGASSVAPLESQQTSPPSPPMSPFPTTVVNRLPASPASLSTVPFPSNSSSSIATNHAASLGPGPSPSSIDKPKAHRSKPKARRRCHRARNPFILYRSHLLASPERRALLALPAHAGQALVSKRAAALWHKLEAWEKAPFFEAAEEDKVRLAERLRAAGTGEGVGSGEGGSGSGAGQQEREQEGETREGGRGRTRKQRSKKAAKLPESPLPPPPLLLHVELAHSAMVSPATSDMSLAESGVSSATPSPLGVPPTPLNADADAAWPLWQKHGHASREYVADNTTGLLAPPSGYAGGYQAGLTSPTALDGFANLHLSPQTGWYTTAPSLPAEDSTEFNPALASTPALGIFFDSADVSVQFDGGFMPPHEGSASAQAEETSFWNEILDLSNMV